MISRPIIPPISRALLDVVKQSMGLPWDAPGGGAATMAALLGSESTLLLDERAQTDSGGGKLTAWQDNSPLANTITQSTDGNRPATGQTIAGFPSPDFDGVDDFVVGPAVSGIISQTLGWHAWAIVRPDTHDAADSDFYTTDLVIGDASGYWGISLSVSGVTAGHYDGATKQTAYIAISDSAVSLIEASWDAATISCRVNAGSAQTVASGTPDLVSGLLRIGSRGALGKYDGRIAFLAACNRKLSAERSGAIRQMLGAKYGVSV